MPSRGVGRAGGQLVGHVLLPRGVQLNAIGGRGLEFFVDGQNYDEHGKLFDRIRRAAPGGIEPGAWRIEISPSLDAETDQFLVVMLPGALGDRPSHLVRLIEGEGRVGCEVVGPRRTTRWLFSPTADAVRIEVAGAAGLSVHEP
jgi:hypothetical protein